MGFFYALTEAVGELSRYLQTVYVLLLTSGRLSFRPLRDSNLHTLWRSLALL